MKSVRTLKWIALLPLLIGCRSVSVDPPESTPPLTDADFDGWQGTTRQKQSVDPAQAGGILSAILDRVESIEARLRPVRPTGGEDQAPVPKVQSPDGAQRPAATLDLGRPLNAWTLDSAPSPAPPAEPFSDSEPAETLDIPKAWTGAAVYHAANCQHCPALLAALKTHATKVSGDYLRIDTPSPCWFLLVDWDKRPDINRPAIGGLPAVLYFVNGHERVKDRVIGFGNRPGELDAILARHPLAAKRAEAVGLSIGPPICPCGPACACLPGVECGCLARNAWDSFALKRVRPAAGRVGL